jgi:hypothetical protein
MADTDLWYRDTPTLDFTAIGRLPPPDPSVRVYFDRPSDAIRSDRLR